MSKSLLYTNSEFALINKSKLKKITMTGTIDRTGFELIASLLAARTDEDLNM